MNLRLILIFAFFWTISCAGQTTNNDIVGQWTFTKLTVTKKGRTLDSLTSEIKSVLSFSADGTYIETGIDPQNAKLTTSGKWKLIEGGKKVRLFDIKTDIPNSVIGDHDWKIIKNKNVWYLTYTYGDSIFAPETMFYKKGK